MAVAWSSIMQSFISLLNSFIDASITAAPLPFIVMAMLWYALLLLVFVIFPPRRAGRGFYSTSIGRRLAIVFMVVSSPLMFPYAIILLWWRASKKIISLIT